MFRSALWITLDSIVIYLLTTVKVTSLQYCDDITLSKCVEKFISDPVNKLVILNANESTIEDFCARYKSFAYCYSELRPSCTNPEPNLSVYDGIDQANAYLCDTSKKEYFQNLLSCYQSSLVEKGCQTCEDFWQAQRKSIANLDPKNKIIYSCKYVDMYLNCMDNILKNLCLPKAYNWAMTYKRKMMQPIMSLYECPGWIIIKEPGVRNDTIVLVLCICISIVVIISCIILVTKTTLFRRFQNKLANLTSRAPALPLPVPPAVPSPPPPPPPYNQLVTLWRHISSCPEEDQTKDFDSTTFTKKNFFTALDMDSENTFNSSTLDDSIFLSNLKQPTEQTDSQRSQSSQDKKTLKTKMYCKTKQKKEKNEETLHSHMTSRNVNSSTHTTDSSIFTTEESRRESYDQQSSGYQVYRGSSELSVYALVHQCSEIDRKISKA